MNPNDQVRIKRAQMHLRAYPLSQCIRMVRRLFALAALPVIIASCTTTSIEPARDDIYITTIASISAYIREEQVALVGTFELVNRSSSPVCFNEDILLNDLSPYIRVSRNDVQQGHVIPHPPTTTAIAQLNPNDQREFRRIVGYKTLVSAAQDRYTVSIQLWECNTPRPFVRRATLVG